MTQETAGFRIDNQEDSAQTIILTGAWTLRGLGQKTEAIITALQTYADRPQNHWDCRQIQSLDNVGALVLWRIHKFKPPMHALIRTEHQAIFERWKNRKEPPAVTRPPIRNISAVAQQTVSVLQGHLTGFITLLGQVMLDSIRIIRHPHRMPWRDISAAIYETGVRALGITALVGALVGVVMSYLAAIELRAFGAQSYIVNILGLSILRELGPLLAAILVAGRSGSSIAAGLGIMRVTEELDALSAMGVSRTLRLVFPKIVALAITVPLLVMWTDVIGLFGGMMTAHWALGINIASFIHAIPSAIPVVNLLLGIIKGVVFGIVIALVAAHFGLRIQPNTQSLGTETTNAVVTAITAVIFVDALFAIVFKGLGLP